MSLNSNKHAPDDTVFVMLIIGMAEDVRLPAPG